MKVGDVIPVDISGHKVTNGKVVEVGDGTVTVRFPATEVVLATRTQLAPEVTRDTNEHQLLGVETPDGAGTSSEEPKQKTPQEEFAELQARMAVLNGLMNTNTASTGTTTVTYTNPDGSTSTSTGAPVEEKQEVTEVINASQSTESD